MDLARAKSKGEKTLVSRVIRDLYQDQYRGDSEGESRRVGAIGKAENIVRAWKSLGGKRLPRVVEIGCGDGAVAQRLSEVDLFESYQGFDLSASGIEECNKKDLPNATFTQVAEDSVPLPDSSADLVIMTHVVEHLENPRGLLQEARRLAPNLIVEVPLELHSRTPLDYDWDPVGHINKYNRVSIRQLLQTCGYEVKGQFTTNPALPLALMRDASWRSKARWVTKDTMLRVAPSRARSIFTYHETLFARGAEQRFRARQ